MSDLENRKKLLVAESEVYRELLKLEIQTFKIHGARAKRRMKLFRTWTPLLMAGLPLAKKLAGRKGRPLWDRIGTFAFFAWRAWSKFGALRTGASARPAPDDKTAAEEYLSKRI